MVLIYQTCYVFGSSSVSFVEVHLWMFYRYVYFIFSLYGFFMNILSVSTFIGGKFLIVFSSFDFDVRDFVGRKFVPLLSSLIYVLV